MKFIGNLVIARLLANPFTDGYSRYFGADTQTIGGIYKDYYEDYISEQANNKNKLKDLFRTETKGFTGSEVVYSAHVGRNISPMFVGEDSAFADAGQQKHIKLRVGQKKLMARTRMTYESMKDSMSNEGAFVQARKDEMESIIDDLARKEEYALATDGRGILALVNGGASSITQTLDSPGNVTGGDFGNRFVQIGMYVGFVNPATGALRASSVRQVVDIATDGTTMTLSATYSSTDNDFVVQVANSAVTDVSDSSFEKAFWGVMGLFDDGTYRDQYFGASRTTWPTYKSYVKANTGALSMDLAQQVSDVLDQKLGGQISDIVCHHSIRRAWLQISESDRRYSDSAGRRNPDAGTQAFKQDEITIGEVPIHCVRDFALGTMLLLDKKGVDLVKYECEKGKWVDEDGSVLVRVGTGSSGRDSFEAWDRTRKEYHARTPGKAARLDGITGQSLVVVQAI